MDLTAQREQQAQERALAATMERERLSVRRGVVRGMLDLRASGDADQIKWRRLLDDSFVCTLPITPFRSFQQAEILHSSRVLRGVEAFIADVRSLAVCIEGIGAPNPSGTLLPQSRESICGTLIHSAFYATFHEAIRVRRWNGEGQVKQSHPSQC